MVKNTFRVPAISHEAAFISQYRRDVDAVLEKRVRALPEVRQLAGRVYERANADVRALLEAATEAIATGTSGIVRISWPNRAVAKNWQRKGTLSPARGRRRQIGWVGVILDYHAGAASLVAWSYPKGGLEDRRKVFEHCRSHGMKGLRLVSDEQDKWPEWDDAIVYFLEPLLPSTDRSAVLKALGAASQRFHRIAKPELEAAADG